MRRWLVGLVIVVFAASACGEDVQTEYSTEVRDNFLVACTDAESDALLTARLCICVFDQAQTRLSFSRFQELEQRITSNTADDMPLAMAQIIADCVISEASL